MVGQSRGPVVGVLALQGDVREHLIALGDCGADPRPVRRPAELVGLDGIVLPGGESTTIDKLSRIFGLREPLVAALRAGLPAYGSCAGMILLADRVLDDRAHRSVSSRGQPPRTPPYVPGFGGIDMTVRRNAFGRQVESFETDLELAELAGPPMHAVFIRAPWVEEVGPEVRVLGRVTPPGATISRMVAVRQGVLLATAFHPEVTADLRVHRYFLDIIRAG